MFDLYLESDKMDHSHFSMEIILENELCFQKTEVKYILRWKNNIDFMNNWKNIEFSALLIPYFTTHTYVLHSLLSFGYLEVIS